MDYLIKEEELKEFANNVKFNHPSVAVDWQTDMFLKDKPPVELLVEGEFSDDWIIENDKLVMGADITRKIYDLGFEGKRVQILLKEVPK